MLGSYPIAGAPIAAGPNANPAALSSQTLALVQRSLSLTTDQNITLGSQTLASTLHSVGLSTSVSLTLGFQSLSATLNSVAPSISIVAPITGQSLSLIQNEVSFGAIVPLDSQALNLALNSVTATVSMDIALTGIREPSPLVYGDDQAIATQPLAALPSALSPINRYSYPSSFYLQQNAIYAAGEAIVPTLASQSMALTLNSVTATVAMDITLESFALSTTLNSVDLATDVDFFLVSQNPLRFTQNGLSVTYGTTVFLSSQHLTLSERNLSLTTDQTVVVGSQTIYTTFNSLREWLPINTWQQTSCSGGIPGQWNPIPFDTEVYGDDQAIATEPLGCLPQPLPPIRKFPGSPWDDVASTTTTTWTNIQT